MNILRFKLLMFISALNFSLFYSNNLSNSNGHFKINEDITDNSIVIDLMQVTNEWIGVPYKYGGISKRGIDCSGFVLNVFKNIIKLPRTAKAQYDYLKKISKEDLRVGDVVFFINGKNKVHHTGIIYKIEDDDIEFIHSSTSKGVTISKLNNGYWSKKIQKFCRI